VHGQIYGGSWSEKVRFERLPYHALADFVFMLGCYQPSRVDADVRPMVGAADDIGEHFAFMIADAMHPNVRPLRLRVPDLHPAISSAAETRIDSWVRQALNNALGELGLKVKSSLEAQGSGESA
jgi:hypothetical protein